MSTTHAAPAPAPDRSGAEPPSRIKVPAPKTSGWRNWLQRFDIRYTPYLLVLPFFIIFLTFALFPLIFNGVVALRHWRLDDPTLTGWAGWENFGRLFTDDDFGNALFNTFGIFVLSTVPQLFLAMVIASVLNRKLRAQAWWRGALLLPYITPITASTIVFAIFFAQGDTGVANWVLSLFGLEDPINWRAEKWSSWIAISTMVNWKWIGYNALLYLAAMQSIPRDVYEAAAIDGAGAWKQLWRITVPMIRPVVIFTIIMATIGGLRLFTEPMLFEQNSAAATGGNDSQWQTVAQLIYKVGWKDLNLGYAAAMSWALFLITVLLVGLNAYITNRRLGGRGQ